MARYELRVKPSVARDLRGVPPTDVRRILARIEALADEPRLQGCEKLSRAELYRVRQRSFRIVYAIDDATVTAEVIRVGHRREGYR